MAEMTLEQQRVLALAQARLRLQEQASPVNQSAEEDALHPRMGPESGLLAGQRQGLPVPMPGIMKDMAAEAAGPAIGQAVGAMTGPFAPAAVPVLGAIGGMGGNALAQFRRIQSGEQTGFRPGQMLGSGVTGAIPGASIAKAGIGTVAREALKYGASNLAGKAVETGVDEGRLPTTGEGAMSFGAGVVAAPVMRAMDSGSRAMATAAEKSRMGPMLDTLASTKKAGYRVNPENITPSKSEQITNSLVRRDIGIPENAPLSQKVVEDRIKELAKPYQELASLSPQMDELVGSFKQAKADAKRMWKAYDASNGMKPELLDAAKYHDELATMFEDEIAKGAEEFGKKDLVTAVKEARPLLAKAYLADRAINYSRGVADAKVYGSLVAKGVPLTGDANVIGNAYNSGLIKQPNRHLPATGLAWYGRYLIDKAEQSSLGQSVMTSPRFAPRPDVGANMARFSTQAQGRDMPPPSFSLQDFMRYMPPGQPTQ